MASYSIRTSRLKLQMLPFLGYSCPLPLSSNRKQDPTWKTILNHLKQLVSRQLSERKKHPLPQLHSTGDSQSTASDYHLFFTTSTTGEDQGLDTLSPSFAARGQPLVARFHRVSTERCSWVAVRLEVHWLFQFCAGPYVRCLDPCRKRRTRW